MKNMSGLGLMAVALALVCGDAQLGRAQPPSEVSPGVADVVRLAQSGVGEDVLLAFIHSSTSYYNLSAENVLYLKDVGISSKVVTAMLTHDSGLRNQPQPPAPSAPVEPPPPPPAEAAPPAYVSNPPVEVT